MKELDKNIDTIISRKNIRKTHIYLFNQLKELGEANFLSFISKFFNLSKQNEEQKLIVLSILSIFEKKNLVLFDQIKKIKILENEFQFIKKNINDYNISGVFLNLLNSSIIDSGSKKKVQKILENSFKGILNDIIFYNGDKIIIEGLIVNKIKNIRKNPKKVNKFQNLNFGFRKLTIIKKVSLTICMSHKDNNFLLKNVAIPSILNQTFKNFKLVVTDDFSEDRISWEKTKKEYEKESRITFLSNNHTVGTYNIRNFVLNNCDTEYFCVADSDDFQMPYRFEMQLDNLAKNDGIVSNWIRFNDEGIAIPRIDLRFAGIATNSFLHKSNLKERIGFYFPLKYAADSEYLQRAKLNNKIIRDKNIVIIGYSGERNLTSDTTSGEVHAVMERQNFADQFKNWHDYNKKPFVEISTIPKEIHIPKKMIVSSLETYRA